MRLLALQYGADLVYCEVRQYNRATLSIVYGKYTCWNRKAILYSPMDVAVASIGVD